MRTRKCIAMVLAGGRGERLGSLTQFYSKPAIHFGGGRRIIDFTLDNCKKSEIGAVAILSQFFNTDLNAYIDNAHDGMRGRNGIYLLPSQTDSGAYKGTADAVYRNLSFVERYAPEHVLILASDHVYRMDYRKLIAFHEAKDATVSVASVPVPMEDVSRFGIINTDEDGRVSWFEEKPRRPKSNLASMGIYIFKTEALLSCLWADNAREQSSHDFGKDILPGMLAAGGIYTYQYNGYWRDVGAVDRLWEASMDHIKGKNIFSDGCRIKGRIQNSVVGRSVSVGYGTEIVNSVIMPNVTIGNNVKLCNAIVGNHSVIQDGAVIGKEYGVDYFVDRQVCDGKVSLVSPWVRVIEGMEIQKNSHVTKEKLEYFYSGLM